MNQGSERMHPLMDGCLRAFGLTAIGLVLVAASAAAQLPEDLDRLSGAELYAASCQNCHGPDGRGLDRSLVGFEEPLPDFTDCDFASREQSGDWVAIAHEGGPVRAFSQMMPAFGGALTVEQVARVVSHIKSFCKDSAWPQGELNMPRAILTEKAFPEDEWVIEADAAMEGYGSVAGAFVWEQRFGPRSQFEVVIPYGWSQVPGTGGDWVSGFGDLVLGVKHALWHDSGAGRILAFGGEVALPTGDENKGFGAPGSKAEGWVGFDQLLPADAFLQLQAGAETPFYDGGENEAFARIALGRTFTSGDWGRSWTPIVELQGKKELEGGIPVALDVVPQMQVSLSRRQHVQASVGALIPATETTGRSVRLVAYLLLDWFDGGFFEGW